jgi:hypothetical protein
MRKLGFIVDKIDSSQQGYFLVRTLNAISQSCPDIDVVAFVRQVSQGPMVHLFAQMPQSEVWGFDGTVIATNLIGAQVMANAKGPKRKLFYVWDLEWTRMSGFRYNDARECYDNDKIELIARSDHHAKAISSSWKEPLRVIKDFEKDHILELVRSK